MSEQRTTSGSRPSWRERRRAKHQRRLERQYFRHEQSRPDGDYGADGLNTTSRAAAYGTPWMAFGGGDGGAGSCGDGGGGGC